MKHLIIILVIIITLLLVSCTNRPGGSESFAAGSYDNYSVELDTKKFYDVDPKIGYKVLVSSFDSKTSKYFTSDIWIPQLIYNQLPNPSDTTKVFLKYLRNMECSVDGNVGKLLQPHQGLFYDQEFNLCIGYTIVKKK